MYFSCGKNVNHWGKPEDRQVAASEKASKDLPILVFYPLISTPTPPTTTPLECGLNLMTGFYEQSLEKSDGCHF